MVREVRVSGTGYVVFVAGDKPDGPVVYDRSTAGTWERLPDPEPLWRRGDVVRAGDGDTYWCTSGAGNGQAYWMKMTANLAVITDDQVPRPLVRLVPERES